LPISPKPWLFSIQKKKQSFHLKKKNNRFSMIKKILIANRGEIAVRIIRGCHEMGIEAVAIYSEPDRKSLAVQLADEAYLVGPAPPLESYLNQEKIIHIAKQSGVEAIHPGYGFLAENGEFARKLEKNDIKFIGPSSQAIDLMGDKTKARKLAEKNGVPTIPGTLDPISAVEDALPIALEIGFPVLLKAAAGGGGKGMRLVFSQEEMEKSFRAAQNEAYTAFGDDRIFLEKYIQQPRHIEFQILADEHGHAIHLWERECSIQRRHQKLVEESPSVLLTPELRKRMGEAALRLTLAAGYHNAGTIEFLVNEDHHFFFLEMNTRLQVEHPVTEWITGIDLVKQQLLIASGEPLSLKQNDIKPKGHAIECRICAEDPRSNFLPSTGEISYLLEPGGIGVRCDSGIIIGDHVHPFYDPLLSKLIIWADTRDEALDRMSRALQEYLIYGVETTIPFFVRLMQNKLFKNGSISTSFLEQQTIMEPDEMSDSKEVAGAVSSLLHYSDKKKIFSTRQQRRDGQTSNWKLQGKKDSLVS
jgi:acetyl-CoA carboxylase biotin carboxylase subunit